MRRLDLEILDLQEIEDVIDSALFCRLAMVDEGAPYIVPMCFGYEDGRLFFHSAMAGRKLGIIRRNGLVCFEITSEAEVLMHADNPEGSVRYRSVTGTGMARVVEDLEEKRNCLRVFSRHYSGRDDEIPVDMARRTTVIEVRIESMTGKRNDG